jgi:hypothetical protein
MMKGSSFSILMDDLKASFKLAVKNILSFLLGMIGVIIVTVLLIAAMAIAVIPVVILFLGIEGMTNAITQLAPLMGTGSGAAAIIFGVGMVVISPLLIPFFVSVGALFGMGREIAESEGTNAEGVFSWYSRKFFSFIGGGLIIFLISMLPLALLMLALIPVHGGSPSGPFAWVLPVGAFIWLTVSLGMLSMTYPAIVDGHSPIEATKISLKMGWTYFDRIFSTFLAFIGIIALLFAPFIIGALLSMPLGTEPPGPLALFGGYAIIVSLFSGLIVLPAFVISLNRAYMILSGEDITSLQEDEHPDVNLVGGV